MAHKGISWALVVRANVAVMHWRKLRYPTCGDVLPKNFYVWSPSSPIRPLHRKFMLRIKPTLLVEHANNVTKLMDEGPDIGH
eukprot:CAMPEP_0180466932 /NCGR_PEP_ID=MMETSP1036_2-20121128/26731_1 /TAXON_ID=632150 /ORGANISM="Azadinium spinosum, Strain 3D9" /LENGTH=81 /DNA_ID=CAMNT_0022473863 /DNA_START=636 /DNA_END=881 /DNA_ORIENTATION=-